ncbi:hypothetical protein [Aegicerativicinus sediminis]|uniref:hypothetical protein n=1 Tax=Aegicerativicinus sediminis TaxID=2893202 RepID=UPI001E54C7E7|nr:hypothetical protein [Aegicerativicinus sediminis]
MKINLKVLTCFLLIFTVVVSCSEKKKESLVGENQIQQPINPNGDSELALLMRQMYDEAQLIKEQINKGEPIEINLNHEKILTAHATQPEKAASEEYRAFANLYLQSIKNLQSANANEVANIYDNMVVSCMTCHKVLCPGPMVKIKQLQ